MPILIEEILEREHQRDSEWAELLDELDGDPELWEVYVDDHWIPLSLEILFWKMTEEITKPSSNLTIEQTSQR
ncbi:MAG: hypothetical protein VW995_18585 [Deltaproteobacteria bacterium]|jgi:hypothetical protein